MILARVGSRVLLRALEMQHGWHPSDALLIQIFVVSGTVVNGLFQAYNRAKARAWEREDREMRVRAARERDEIAKGLDRNTELTERATELTAATAQQVAETHNLTLREMLEKANAGWTALRHRHQVEENAGAEAEARHGIPR